MYLTPPGGNGASSTASERVPENKWRWYGNAAHFIGGNQCCFHMATEIGRFVVSTVGEYRPKNEDGEPMEIGFKRKYETYVFKKSRGRCECGCGLPQINPSEIEGIGANNAKDANRNHRKTCDKYASRGAHP